MTEVRPMRESDSAAWDRYVREHPGSSIYHSLSWRRVTEEGLGHTGCHLLAGSADGGITGVLPLFLVKTVLGRRLVSVPMRDRGGVIADDPEVARGLVAGAVDLARQHRCSRLELRTLEPLPGRVVEANALDLDRYWLHSKLDLSAGRDALWRSMPRTAVRRAVSRAGKRGVQVVLEESRGGMETFHRLFVHTRTSMGIPPYGRRFFLAMWRHLGREGAVRLFLVKKGQQAIGGLVGFVWREVFVGAYAAPQPEYREYNPSEAAIWESMCWAMDRGLETYDFGSDSPEQKGLIWFKKKFGAEVSPTFTYRHLRSARHARSWDSSRTTYSAARKLWSGFPDSLSAALGSWVTRQLD